MVKRLLKAGLLAVITIALTLSAMPVLAAINTPEVGGIEQSYSPGEEITELRDQYSTTHIGQNGNYLLTSYLGSIHYQDANGDFQPIDTTIVPSDKPNWDWEVTTGHWQLFIKNDTTIGVKKGDNWVGTRLHGIAYLDITTKDYTILQTTNTVIPVVNDNKIVWNDILYGVDFILHYTNDSLKEEIVVSQAARDFLSSAGHRPSDYGYDAQNTYLVPIFECDWSQGLPMRLIAGSAINPDQAETEEVIYFESDTEDPYWKTKLVSFLPVDYAVSVNPINPEDPEEDWEYASEKIRKRLVTRNDKHWLLIGVPVTKLNQMPEGSIVFDPTETLRPDGAGDETNLVIGGLSPAATNWQSVDEVTADEITTTVERPGTSATYARDLYNLADSSGNGTINSVTVYIRGWTPIAPAYAKESIKSGGTTADGGEITLTTNWVTYSNVWSTPPEGGSWTWAKIDALQAGVSGKGGGLITNTAHCTQVYVIVDYTPVAAPTVTTQAVDTITDTTATGHGTITDNGTAAVSAWGVCWNTGGNPTTADNTAAGSGAGGIGAFTASLTSLTAGTLYYVKAYATNAVGTGYGSQVEFTTLEPPDITTNAATDVAQTTARLNSILVDDGGESCNVSFQYNTVENWTTCDNTSWVTGYTTGQYPYADISSLAPNTLYYFRAQVKNTVGSDNGTALTFTTETDVFLPTNFKSFPEATQVSLSWTKGIGSTNTLVRHKVGSYPTTTADGTQVYLGILNSYAHTGLTSGNTYYYSAWGVSGDNFSASYATVMATTSGVPAVAAPPGAPAEPTTWFQTPDYEKFSELPLYSILNDFGDALELPRASFWFLFGIFQCGFCGVIVLAVSKHAVPAMIALAGAFAIASLVELLPGWMMAFTVIFIIGAWQFSRMGRAG